MPDARAVRIAALSDLHYDRRSGGLLAQTFEAASEAADVLLLCGDLTDYGTREEAELLAHDLRAHARIPALAVLGNHDFESGTPEVVVDVMEDQAGVKVLDGGCAEVCGVGFAGVRGFGGGFGKAQLSAWGEPPIKAFVQEAVDEALKLDAALARLETEHRVVLLHYSPLRETVVGEPEEIFAFLGTSRLEEPLNRHRVAAAFHGHAHRGAPEGHTAAGIPVYNVSVPVLRTARPEEQPFRLFEVRLDVPAESPDEVREATADLAEKGQG